MRKIRSGKATFFVANQDTLDALPEQKIKALAEETEALTERNKTLGAEIKAASAGACVISSFPCSKRRGGRGNAYILSRTLS